jgi:hypothetical protein
MKVLCICENGNVRSVALAYLLKTIFGHEAIAIGAKKSSTETQEMLIKWADKVIIFNTAIPYFDKPFDIVFDLGEDKWHNPLAQELIHKLYKELSKHPELWK